MKLIRIEGKLWELTRQADTYGDQFDKPEMPLDVANHRCIFGQNIEWRGLGRLLAGNGVRPKALAIIEIEARGLPAQQSYVIYHASKGFFCKVQGERVYLHDIATPLSES
jgi:hypothetical protein